jgi:hypothetical protein
MAINDEEQKATAKKSSARTWIEGIGRVRALVIGIGAVAGALTAVFAFIFILFPNLNPPLEGWATLSIARVEHNVTFGEYLQRPWVPQQETGENDEQLKMVGNIIYFDIETQDFAGKEAYTRYTVYDTHTEKPVSGLAFRSAWPSDVVVPGKQTSKAQMETWVPVPQDGSIGPYRIWIELYTIVNQQERRLASDEEMIGE